MRPSKTVPTAALVLAGVLTGNEAGTAIAVHPALARLPMPAGLLAEQMVTRSYGAVMPPLMTATIAATTAAAATSTGRRRRLFGAAACCYAVMLAVTFTGNLPLNAATLHLTTDDPEQELREVRRRWDRFHALRVALDVAGLTLAAAAANTSRSGDA